MILKNIADCQSREKRGEKSKDGIKRVSKGDRAQKAYKKKRLIIVSKKNYKIAVRQSICECSCKTAAY